MKTIAADAKSPALLKHCWKLAVEAVSESDAGDYNQSLMELGATVCTPRSPTVRLRVPTCTRCA